MTPEPNSTFSSAAQPPSRFAPGLRRVLLPATLNVLVLLTLLAIVGAFLGAERARRLFNSSLLIVFWAALAVLLLIGLAALPRLIRQPGLLGMHLGCTIVLLGAMWGSERAHAWQKRHFGIDKVPRAQLDLVEGQAADALYDPNEQPLARLPFELALNGFWIDYYWDPGVLEIRTDDSAQGGSWQLPAQPGRRLDLPGDLPTLRVLRVFRSLALGEFLQDDPRGELNPAVELEVESPGGGRRVIFVFELHQHPGSSVPGLRLSYRSFVAGEKGYFSDLVLLDPAAHRQQHYLLKVNHPLHYGGYHFYQSGCRVAPDGRWVSVLAVVSDTGLTAVFVGFALLLGGVFWHFWLRPIVTWFARGVVHGD